MGIMDVDNALINLLRANLVPDVIQNPDAIGLCSPDEKGDMLLGLHLYDIRENEEIRLTDMVNLDAVRQKYPSSYITLCYMVTAYSNADVKFRAGEDHKILNRVLQVFGDNTLLDASTLEPTAKAAEMNLRIRIADLNLEEKQRLWNFPNNPYRASLFYRVAPVEVESGRTRDVGRVVDVDFKVEEQGRI
ncbi:MAG: DUF4255 domain-containing protein [Peptococcaceae bacterium]|jgi:hypothetical protein|nr:DUF4255 domain-containing protein [Peptococcaceae bacterium]